MKVAYVAGINSNLDALRGIGVSNRILVDTIRGLKIQDIEVVDDVSKADLVHYVKFHPFFISLPFVKPSKKVILTIHDLIPLIYPKHYPPGIKGKISFLINKFLIYKNVDQIITISETSKKDICRYLGVKPSIVKVIYIAPKTVFKKLEGSKWKRQIKEKFNLPDKFVLFDHGVNYNKNLPTLIKACNAINMPLAVVGKEIENLDKLDLNHPELNHLKEIDFSKVFKLGYVEDDDLNKLFNMAHIYVQPSYYEGFGMPVVEAMKVGCPVICSKTQALVEISGDACLYFDPFEVKDLVAKIRIFDSDKDLRHKYIKKGTRQVKKFSWLKTAQETLDLYAKV